MPCLSKFCDKDQYYRNQAQTGGDYPIRRFVAPRRIKGYGIFSKIASRYAIPVLKYLGKEALKTGTSVLTDVIKPEVEEMAKTALKKRASKTIGIIGKKIGGESNKRKRKTNRKPKKSIISQRASGRKGKKKSRSKKKKIKTSKKTKNSFRNRDIFKTF